MNRNEQSSAYRLYTRADDGRNLVFKTATARDLPLKALPPVNKDYVRCWLGTYTKTNSVHGLQTDSGLPCAYPHTNETQITKSLRSASRTATRNTTHNTNGNRN